MLMEQQEIQRVFSWTDVNLKLIGRGRMAAFAKKRGTKVASFGIGVSLVVFTSTRKTGLGARDPISSCPYAATSAQTSRSLRQP